MYTIQKFVPEYGYDVCATVSLLDDQFFITYSTPLSSGYCPEFILQWFPELADVVPLHLSRWDGMPLQVFSSGKLWLSLEMDVRAAWHFRIPVEHVADLRELCGGLDALGSEKADAILHKWIDQQKGRWQAEADAVIIKYNLLDNNDQE